MDGVKTYVLFLFLVAFSACGVEFTSAGVLYASDQTAQPNDEEIYTGGYSPAARALSFAKKRDENEKKMKKRIIRSMNNLRKGAGDHRKKGVYHKSSRCSYEASIQYPSTLLFFKFAEMGLQDVLGAQELNENSLSYVLKDFQLGFEFY